MALGKSQLSHHGFSPVKGELLTVQLNRDLGKECIHQGHFMLGEEDQKASIGATYAWEGFEDGPSPKAKEELIQHIDKVWSEEYKVIDHYAGTRPATKDRRPIIGPHPVKDNVWVFNGMGSRAVLMVPVGAVAMRRRAGGCSWRSRGSREPRDGLGGDSQHPFVWLTR